MKDQQPGFFAQLRLLLWKNLKVKIRHPFVLILELIIPLFLFFVMVGIRQGHPPALSPEVHYTNKPLPSAGIIPILESFCSNFHEQDFSNNKTRLTSILELIQITLEEIHNVQAAVHIPESSRTDLSTWINWFTNQNLTDYETSWRNRTQYSIQWKLFKALEKFVIITQTLFGTTVDMNVDNLKSMVNNNTSSSLRNKDFKSSGKFDGMEQFQKSIETIVCGIDKISTKQSRKTRRANTGKYNTKGTPFYHHGKFRVYRHETVKLIKHFLYNNPKILYAPNNTVAGRIVNKVNKKFRMFSNLTVLAKQWKRVTITKRIAILQYLERLSLIIASRPTSNLQHNVSNILNIETINQLFNVLDTVANTWLSLAQDINFDVFQGFESEAKLEEYFQNRQSRDNISVIAGVVFMNLNSSMTNLPRHVNYKIRQNATFTPPTSKVRSTIWLGHGHRYLQYYDFGFVWIQDMIERSIIDIQTGTDVVQPGTYLKRMPYPCYTYSSFVWLIKHTVPLCLMLSCIYSVTMLVQRIVYEKEKRLNIVTRMMGLSNGVHVCGWFITAFIQLTITMVALTAMMFLGHMLPYSDPWIIFIFLETFAVSCIAFSLLISSLFSNANVASACAGIFYVMSYVPYVYIAVRDDITGDGIHNSPVVLKILFSIFSPTAMGLGCKYIFYYEIDGIGVRMSNIASSPIEGDDFNLMIVLKMMWIDTFCYLILTWYIENVHPGSYGIPRPWYFPFTLSYWFNSPSTHYCCFRRQYDTGDKIQYSSLPVNDDDLTDGLLTEVEQEPNMPIGVVISKLTKVYGQHKTPAISRINLTLFEGQITTLLGHNGAGKTTLMSILCGLFPATSGTVTIYGNDIAIDRDDIRTNLGFCPQHNVLFDSLTIEEHLWFYARLKGHDTGSIRTNTERILKDTHLQDKRKYLPGQLSGGMLRKLSVAISFIGESKTVILDEPTAGVDPSSRRAIWDLIIKYKKGRTILLSTHHMDEAEILSDQVVILSHGQMICSGSPVYLKSTFGRGLHLQIIRRNKSTVADSFHDILTRVRETIPASYIKSTKGPEVHIVLSIDIIRKAILVNLFESLMNAKDELDIETYGIVNCGIEEVFMNITEEMVEQNIYSKGIRCPTYQPTNVQEHSCDLKLDDMAHSNHDSDHDTETLYNDDDGLHCHLQPSVYNIPAKRVSIFKHLHHIRALLIKRFRYTIGNKRNLISQIVLPVVFLTVAMTIALAGPTNRDPPPLTLSTSQYNELTKQRENIIPYTYKRNIVTKIFDDLKQNCNVIKNLVNTFKLPSGIGADCILKRDLGPSLLAEINEGFQLNKSRKLLELLPEYFVESCRNVFKAGVFVDTKFLSSEASYNSTTENMTEEATHENTELYPDCACKNGWFKCSNWNGILPSSYRVVTRDVLQDISNVQDEELFYMNTANDYRFHRLGGFSLDHKLSYVPNQLGKPSAYRSVMRSMVIKDAVKVRFNPKGYHSLPIYVNVLNNAILRANIPTSKGNQAEYGITLINHPFENTNNLLHVDTMHAVALNYALMAIFIIVAMSFVPASFVVFLVHEKSIKAKHLQFLSGVNPVVYWLSNYVWDMCNYLIPGVCVVVILLVFNIPAFVSSGNFEAVVTLFLLYGWSVTSMMYPSSFVFTEGSVAYIVLVCINLFTGCSCILVMFILERYSKEDPDLLNWSNVLKKGFLVFPNYCLGNGLITIAKTHYKNEFFVHTGQPDKIESALSWEITGLRFVIMAIEGFVFLIITILYEYWFFVKYRTLRRVSAITDNQEMALLDGQESSTEEEEHDALLNIVNLTKIYKRRRRSDVVAVDTINISVRRGECFGFLGVNGAGKTTTFKMLTGVIKPTSGDAKLNGHSIFSNMSDIYANIGYCPQFDALFDELTPVQHLQLYSRLRGISAINEQKLIPQMLSQLDLGKYAHQSVGTLSGGNKRKLSTAIALVGDPQLIYMDEPTTGMDPYSKRFLWKFIRKLVDDGKSVIFTSHSMEECVALCSRVSIMSEGQIKCQGTIQQLKYRYGNGYTLEVATDTCLYKETREIREYIEGTLEECVFIDMKHKTLMFEVHVSCDKLAHVYRLMEYALDTFDITDFSLSQNTLDNVFMNFVKQEQDVGTDRDDSLIATSCRI